LASAYEANGQYDEAKNVLEFLGGLGYGEQVAENIERINSLGQVNTTEE